MCKTENQNFTTYSNQSGLLFKMSSYLDTIVALPFFIPPNCNDVLSGAEIDGKTLRVREYVRDSLIFYQNISLTVEKNKVNKLRQIRDDNDGISNNNDSNDC